MSVVICPVPVVLEARLGCLPWRCMVRLVGYCAPHPESTTPADWAAGACGSCVKTAVVLPPPPLPPPSPLPHPVGCPNPRRLRKLCTCVCIASPTRTSCHHPTHPTRPTHPSLVSVRRLQQLCEERGFFQASQGDLSVVVELFTLCSGEAAWGAVGRRVGWTWGRGGAGRGRPVGCGGAPHAPQRRVCCCGKGGCCIVGLQGGQHHCGNGDAVPPVLPSWGRRQGSSGMRLPR